VGPLELVWETLLLCCAHPDLSVFYFRIAYTSFITKYQAAFWLWQATATHPS
jgi:hypothetical protein